MGTCTSCLGLREKLVDTNDPSERVEFLPQSQESKPRSGSEKLQGENEEEEEFKLITFNTTLEFRRVRSNSKRRCNSAPAKLLEHEHVLTQEEIGPEEKPPETLTKQGLKVERGEEDQRVVPRELDGEEEGHIVHILNHPSDDAFEPQPFTFEMVAGMTAARRLRIWQTVPDRPHACGNTCTACCSLFNAAWRLATMHPFPVGRQPGHPSAGKDLEVPDDLPEHSIYIKE